MGMKEIYSLIELPPDSLAMFSVKDKDEADKIFTQYSTGWLYKGRLLFVLATEYEKNQKVQA